MISDAKEPKRLLKKPAVLEIVPMCPAQLQALVREGKFPAPVHLGGTAVAWVQDEVAAWIDARIAERERCTGQPDAGPPSGQTHQTRHEVAESCVA